MNWPGYLRFVDFPLLSVQIRENCLARTGENSERRVLVNNRLFESIRCVNETIHLFSVYLSAIAKNISQQFEFGTNRI